MLHAPSQFITYPTHFLASVVLVALVLLASSLVAPPHREVGTMKDPQAIKAILIPALSDTPLALVDIADRDNPKAYAAVIRCAWIERVTTILTRLHGLVLLVDEEGVYADPQIHNRRASLLVGSRAHIVGDALLVREDSHGDWHTPRAPKCTLGMVRNLVDIVDDLTQEATL